MAFRRINTIRMIFLSFITVVFCRVKAWLQGRFTNQNNTSQRSALADLPFESSPKRQEIIRILSFKKADKFWNQQPGRGGAIGWGTEVQPATHPNKWIAFILRIPSSCKSWFRLPRATNSFVRIRILGILRFPGFEIAFILRIPSSCKSWFRQPPAWT